MAKYHGWTNRATWAVHLWLTSEESLYHSARGLDARELEAFMEDLMSQENLSPMASDFVNIALADVNWREIAKALNE